jgi:nucleotidyltransferase substrate binding protein (TIGR01987 family)
MALQKSEAARKKAQESLEKLERSLQHLNSEKDATDRWVRLDAVAKRFEVAFEYVWKAFKVELEDRGEDVVGPKDSITVAAKYKWIDNIEDWIIFLQTRNAGVHDYYGLPEESYAKIAEMFLSASQKAISRM